MYQYVHRSCVNGEAMDYLEFGVLQGDSIRCWAGLNKHEDSRLYGFDSFEGLPEDWRKGQGKGHFDVGGNMPQIDDPQVKFVKGWFDSTVPTFAREFVAKNRPVMHLNADLYGSTMLPLHLEKLFLGRHKFYHFRVWYRLSSLHLTGSSGFADPGATVFEWPLSAKRGQGACGGTSEPHAQNPQTANAGTDAAYADRVGMKEPLKQISVCVCTYKRPRFLKRLLQELTAQETGGNLALSIVVVDNDRLESAKPVVTDFAASSRWPVTYCVEPEQNIALARNKGVANAASEFVVFIDDDEFPGPDWLRHLCETCQRAGVAGVLGPVRPHFEQEPPAWVRKGGFYERPTHATGFVMDWRECRTGNVLFRRSIVEGLPEVFRREFGSDGEDQDFFRRMIERGSTFLWCNEAVVFEVVPAHRWRRRFMLQRALLRGRNCLRHPDGRGRAIVQSLVAVPLYGLALPFLLLAGHHLFMKYLIKICDHAGRLLALVGLNPVEKREL